MHFIKELMHIFPGEWMIFILTAIPAGKGSLCIILGICEYNFSFWKITLLCSLGTCFKAGYYFPLIYGAEKYLHGNDTRLARTIRPGIHYYLEKVKKKHQTLCRIMEFISPRHLCQWFDEVKNNHPRTYYLTEKIIFFSGLVVLWLIMCYCYKTKHVLRVLVMVFSIALAVYAYFKRSNHFITYASLFIVPNAGGGILLGAYLAYLYGFKFARGFAVVMMGSIVSTFAISAWAIYYKPQLLVIWKSFFF